MIFFIEEDIYMHSSKLFYMEWTKFSVKEWSFEQYNLKCDAFLEAADAILISLMCIAHKFK